MDIQEIFSPDTSNKLTSAIRDLDEAQEKSGKLCTLMDEVIKLYSESFDSKQFLQDPDLGIHEKRMFEFVVSFQKSLQDLQNAKIIKIIKGIKEFSHLHVKATEILIPILDQPSENDEMIEEINKWFWTENDEISFNPGMAREILGMSLKLIAKFTGIFKNIKACANVEYLFGKAYIAKGNWYQGLKHLEISLLIQREFDDFNARAATVYEIGRVHQLLDNSDEARMCYRDALRLYQHVGNLSGVMACKLALGNIAAQQGFVKEGIKLLQETKQFYMAHNQEELTQNVESVLQFLNQVKEKRPA